MCGRGTDTETLPAEYPLMKESPIPPTGSLVLVYGHCRRQRRDGCTNSQQHGIAQIELHNEHILSVSAITHNERDGTPGPQLPRMIRVPQPYQSTRSDEGSCKIASCCKPIPSCRLAFGCRRTGPASHDHENGCSTPCTGRIPAWWRVEAEFGRFFRNCFIGQQQNEITSIRPGAIHEAGR